ncbi:MAG: TolC family protein [Pyrinomonadaceae bacterium]|nr:TolC family protein [Pyrinomonadaceae bacterium]MBP6212468.1 TolC family protein [Pyrinomonadaceae bacterium]
MLTAAVSAAAQTDQQVAQIKTSNISTTPAVTTPVSLPGVTTMNRVGVQTAQPISLTLDDAIRRALENNNDIEFSRTSVRIGETSIRSQLGIFDPVFTVNPNYTRNSSTGSAATNDFRVNGNMTKFIRPGGGNYQVFFNNQRTENQFAQAQVTSGSVASVGSSAVYSSSLGISYTQPLARNFNIDSKRQQLKIAKKRLEQNDSDFRLQAIRTISSVQSAYWDLVFALRNQQNVSANVNLARENLRQIEAKIDAGAAAPLERASVETELASREGDLLSATQQVSVAENQLKQLLLKDTTAPEWTQTFMPTDKPVFSVDSANLDTAMKDAMDNRFELKRLKLQNEINDIDIRYFKNQTRPQIDLNTTFSLDGFSRGNISSASTFVNQFNGNEEILRTNLNTLLPPGSQIPNPLIAIPGAPSYFVGGFGRSMSNMFRTDAPNYSIGVTISFPFRNRTAKANLDAARITGEQIAAQTRGQEQSVIVEVRNAVQAVETTRQRVLTARRARESAETLLDGERKLYDAGRSTTFILFQRENSLANARNAEIRAETDYNKALSDLQRATATSLRANNITLASPLDIK